MSIRRYCDYAGCEQEATMGGKDYDLCDWHYEVWKESDPAEDDNKRLGYEF